MPPDTQDPVVAITKIMVNDTADQVTLYGTATDNIGVVSVDWANAETSGSGSCTFSAPAWECDIAVQAGDNTITITAADAAANTGVATLVVDYTAPAAGGTTVIKKRYVILED